MADGTDQKYWHDGLPFEGLPKTTTGAQKYWYDGLPADFLVTDPAGGTAIPVIADYYARQRNA